MSYSSLISPTSHIITNGRTLFISFPRRANRSMRRSDIRNHYHEYAQADQRTWKDLWDTYLECHFAISYMSLEMLLAMRARMHLERLTRPLCQRKLLGCVLYCCFISCVADDCCRVQPSEQEFPHFQIISAAKTGSTSLYQYLCQHPNVSCAAKRKELNLLRSYQLNDISKKVCVCQRSTPFC